MPISVICVCLFAWCDKKEVSSKNCTHKIIKKKSKLIFLCQQVDKILKTKQCECRQNFAIALAVYTHNFAMEYFYLMSLFT